jgi:hypothetical protein
MNLNVDLTAIEWKKLRPNARVLGLIICALALVAALWGTWHWMNHPPRPWLVRWRLDRYLAKKAETKDFKANFAFPSQAEMSKKVTRDRSEQVGSRTSKDFETLRDEYFSTKTEALKIEAQLATNASATLQTELQAKEQALAPIVADLWEFQRKWMDETVGSDGSPVASLNKARREFVSEENRKMGSAESYPVMYKSIGQELFVAERLLESQNYEHRRVGVSIALDAGRAAMNYAQDPYAAARICEAYVLPNLDLADDANRQSPFAAQNLLNECERFFRANGEWDNMARAYESYAKNATNPRQKDWANFQIANVHQQSGDLKKALVYLQKVKNTNDFGVGRRIAWIQRRVNP